MAEAKGIRIGRLTARDIKQALALLNQAFRGRPLYTLVGLGRREVFFTPRQLKMALRNPYMLFLVAKHGKKVVGFSNVWAIYGGVGLSGWLVVHPDYRHQGIGRALAMAEAKICKARGCHTLITVSRTGNTAGEGLLKATDWKKLIQLKRYWYKQDYWLWEHRL